MIGELIDGRYEIEDLVGTGGMSSVYRARDTVLEREVALKILHDHFSGDPDYVERFRREARAIARLNHPNIVTVIDRGEFGGRQFIVFEHVPGHNLKDVVRRHGPLPVPEALALTQQIARGLAFAHDHGVVHRDVKPQNVLLDENGTVKVTDFGIARSIDPRDELTQTGTMLGTSDYIAPEQASGRRVDARSDQYSLGVLLYELLTGEPPYSGDTFMAVAMKHVRDPVPSVRKRRPDVSSRVEEILVRAMAKRPEDRFPTTEAMTAALETALAEEGTDGGGGTEVTGVLPRGSRATRPGTRRRFGISPLWAALLVIGAGALVLGVLLATRDSGSSGAQVGTVKLTAAEDYDPQGDGTEHPDSVSFATDGNPSTFWTTETYRSFMKPGVGLILDAGKEVEIEHLQIVTDTPGFTAEILAGNDPGTGFVRYSQEQEIGPRTTLELAGGTSYRYYVIWITDPNSRAHVNEIRAG
jgi:eukaryotic-like serine/threonine-protein kinase